ncbi:2TM domain-containing protein [Spirosoma sp. KUDC1026]|uniref:2TM domain-containing protein n=1 Tax=Spirosoma sp. KUDC1026 TaxID=2745947 RepID=UPI00159BABC0|nr:2TM domain-containing protein [Spirosoma sp. KUDC1026]QKZ13320.1 2TM domain-containing protein [Spirosoma sp. KUDC1026]
METQHDPLLWKQAKERVGFRMHLRTYLIINIGLWLIWAVTLFMIPSRPRVYFPWPLFASFGWGIGLVSHYLSVYRRGNQRDMVEEEYQKLLARQ